MDIGPDELQQLKTYALAVASDTRFDTERTRWEFWAISARVKGTADRERRSREHHGLAFVDPEVNVRVWVKTWAEVLQDAEHRLKYVKGQLGVSADQKSAVDYLRRVHGEKLPGALADEQAA